MCYDTIYMIAARPSIAVLQNQKHGVDQLCDWATLGCFNLALANRLDVVTIKWIADQLAGDTTRPYTVCTWSLVPDSPEVLMIEDLTEDAR